MNDFKVDWNDHIGEFIRLKATQPHVLTEMLRRQQYHSQEKEIQRKIQHLKQQHEELQSQLSTQTNKLEALSNKNSNTQLQIRRLEADCRAIQQQLQRSSKQLQIRHKTKSSRSSLDGTNNTSSESSLVFLKRDLYKKVSNQSVKHQLEITIQKAIAQKVSLKEQIERLSKKVYNIQETVKKNIKLETIKEEMRKIRPTEEKLIQQKGILIERHRSKLLELQRPGKLTKIQQGIVQQSFKRLQTFVKQTKKLISNEKTKNSKKAQDFLNKYSRFNDYLNDQKQLNRLVERSPELRGVQYNPKFHQLGNYEDLQNQMLSELEKKDINTKFFRELYQELRLCFENCDQLKQKQAVLDKQIKQYKEKLQEKKNNIHSQKIRIKSCRSI